MQYMCVVYQDENKLDALSQDELDAVVSACIDWVDELEKSGHHTYSAGLQCVRTATTVRHRNGKLALTDGPFAETKEFLAGFTLIKASDLNEAIRLASKFPAAHLGSMEVRPVLESGGELPDALDKKIGASMRRCASAIDPTTASRFVSLPERNAAREP